MGVMIQREEHIANEIDEAEKSRKNLIDYLKSKKHY